MVVVVAAASAAAVRKPPRKRRRRAPVRKGVPVSAAGFQKAVDPYIHSADVVSIILDYVEHRVGDTDELSDGEECCRTCSVEWEDGEYCGRTYCKAYQDLADRRNTLTACCKECDQEQYLQSLREDEGLSQFDRSQDKRLLNEEDEAFLLNFGWGM